MESVSGKLIFGVIKGLKPTQHFTDEHCITAAKAGGRTIAPWGRYETHPCVPGCRRYQGMKIIWQLKQTSHLFVVSSENSNATINFSTLTLNLAAKNKWNECFLVNW